MCMNILQPEGQSSTFNCSAIKVEASSPNEASYPRSLSENSYLSTDDHDIIEFGPIKVKPRKKPAPTLATGRRSKYETLSPEDEQKRELRRARNRAAAERVRINRLGVEQNLKNQIDVLQQEEKQLLVNIDNLQREKLKLESRILTHEQICPTRLVSGEPNGALPVFVPNSAPISTTSYSVEQSSYSYFEDLISDSISPVQISSNSVSNPYTNMVTGDDFDMFFMDL